MISEDFTTISNYMVLALFDKFWNKIEGNFLGRKCHQKVKQLTYGF